MASWTITGVIVVSISVISFMAGILLYFGLANPGLTFIYPMIAGVFLLAVGLYMIYLDRDTPYA